MASSDDVVIISGCRTAVGKFQGSLSDLTAPQLGAIVVREAVKRAGIEPAQVDECIMGNVISAGLGQNPARQAAIYGGLTPEVSAMTVNKVCGSGLKAVALAAQAIQTGNASIVVAGGMESMTNAPYLLPNARKGYRLGNGQLVDSMVHDGLWDIYNDYQMLRTVDNAADKHEGQRADTTGESLRARKPAFKKDGTVTAGNAPGVNDGAAALVVTSAARAKELDAKPMVRIVDQATSGIDPKWVMMAPVGAVRQIWHKTGWKNENVDLYELNEAFSVQALGVIRELGLHLEAVNVAGSEVVIGHPIAAGGARVML